MEVFKCECGRGFNLGTRMEFDCPRCKIMWKVEPTRGYYRLYKWQE